MSKIVIKKKFSIVQMVHFIILRTLLICNFRTMCIYTNINYCIHFDLRLHEIDTNKNILSTKLYYGIETVLYNLEH